MAAHVAMNGANCERGKTLAEIKGFGQERAMKDKNALIQPDRGQKATDIHLVDKAGLEGWLKTLSGPQRAAVEAQKFKGAGYTSAIVPQGDGWFVAGGVADTNALSSWCMAKLAETLPAGIYRLVKGDAGKAMLGWQTAQYRFDRYRSEAEADGDRVLLTKEARTIDAAVAEARAIALVRDLVNTPAEDMGPAQLEAEAEALGKAYGAKLTVTKGDRLESEFPMVHGVGRAASREHAPRMIELNWGSDKHPRIALVGKGVCFDSGGLDIKNAKAMELMKKDMGGAAHALALAGLVMGAGLKVRLQVLVPAVENAISGNAFRPGDILSSRKGLSVEIGNTDAEGRLILGDALALASESKPQLVLDFATLTGAARVALGPDLPALFARREETAVALTQAGKAVDDEVWPMPLHKPYGEYLKSDVADLNNAGGNGFAGAIVAAMFLDKFVGEGTDWAHFDTYAWRPAAKPGRPKGGDALGLRAAWKMLQTRYS
jgi:leucyl aminopeptidase